MKKNRPRIEVLYRRIAPSRCPNEEIRDRALGCPCYLLLTARHPKHHSEVLRCYMIESDADFYVWVFLTPEGRVVWDIHDKAEFDDLLYEYAIPGSMMSC